MLFDDCLTKKISLALISSSLVLSGCHYDPPTEEQRAQEEKDKATQVANTPATPVHTNWWYFHHTGTTFTPGHVGSPHFSGGSIHISSGSGIRSSGGFSSRGSVSARGGFGSAGHSFGGGG